MKKYQLTEAKIVPILKQHEGGCDPMEFCREFGISKARLYNWRKNYAGINASHFGEMKAL
jgi:putative transposase